MDGTIRYLRISNFRSIDVLELRDIQPFSVFAGPNGSGKSNFFDALDFVSKLLRFGAEEAVRLYGGIESISCHSILRKNTHLFSFYIDVTLPKKGDTALKNEQIYSYNIILDSKENFPQETLDNLIKTDGYSHTYTSNFIVLERQVISCGEKKLFIYQRDESTHIFQPINEYNNILKHLDNSSYATIFRKNLKDIICYRINTVSAKIPSLSSYDSSRLNENGGNLPAVLRKLERNIDKFETISEWLQLVIPGFQKIYTHTEHLTGSTVLALQEEGAKKSFPAHLISDGTVYLLCLLAAILQDRGSLSPQLRKLIGEASFTLIEEPERGLHPKAIQELVKLFREKAVDGNRIWLTTHSETVVRGLRNGELWLVDKDANGATQMKKAEIPEGVDLPVDEMWLCNILNGGLPW